MLIDAILAIAVPCIGIAYSLHYLPACGKSVHDVRLFLFKARLAFPG